MKIDCIIIIFVYPENCFFFNFGNFWPIFGLFLPIWSILGRKLRMLTVAFPSLEAFFTRSKLNESAFYYILKYKPWQGPLITDGRNSCK